MLNKKKIKDFIVPEDKVISSCVEGGYRFESKQGSMRVYSVEGHCPVTGLPVVGEEMSQKVPMNLIFRRWLVGKLNLG